MTVYADVLVIVNLYVDYILLCLVKSFLRMSAPGYRLVLGALMGGALSLLGLLPLPGWAGPFTAGAASLLTALAAFAPRGKRLDLYGVEIKLRRTLYQLSQGCTKAALRTHSLEQ